MWWTLWFPLLCFAAGWTVGWIQGTEPLKMKIRILELTKSDYQMELDRLKSEAIWKHQQ